MSATVGMRHHLTAAADTASPCAAQIGMEHTLLLCDGVECCKKYLAAMPGAGAYSRHCSQKVAAREPLIVSCACGWSLLRRAASPCSLASCRAMSIVTSRGALLRRVRLVQHGAARGKGLRGGSGARGQPLVDPGAAGAAGRQRPVHWCAAPCAFRSLTVAAGMRRHTVHTVMSCSVIADRGVTALSAMRVMLWGCNA